MSLDGQQGPDAYTSLVVKPHEQAIICGQAVNLWALLYLPQAPELEDLQPFVSKDLDILGDEKTFAELRALGNWSAAVLFTPKPGKTLEVVGALRAVRSDGSEINVEIRRSVHGLDTADLQRMADVEVDGATYVIMEPHACLKAKLANLADIPQDGRQDGRHVKILVSCLRYYIEEIHALAVAGEIPPERVQTLIRESSAVMRSTKASTAAAALGIDFRTVISKTLTESPIEQIRGTALRAFSSIETVHQTKPSQSIDL